MQPMASAVKSWSGDFSEHQSFTVIARHSIYPRKTAACDLEFPKACTIYEINKISCFRVSRAISAFEKSMPGSLLSPLGMTSSLRPPHVTCLFWTRDLVRSFILNQVFELSRRVEESVWAKRFQDCLSEAISRFLQWIWLRDFVAFSVVTRDVIPCLHGTLPFFFLT